MTVYHILSYIQVFMEKQQLCSVAVRAKCFYGGAVTLTRVRTVKTEVSYGALANPTILVRLLIKREESQQETHEITTFPKYHPLIQTNTGKHCTQLVKKRTTHGTICKSGSEIWYCMFCGATVHFSKLTAV